PPRPRAGEGLPVVLGAHALRPVPREPRAGAVGAVLQRPRAVGPPGPRARGDRVERSGRRSGTVATRAGALRRANYVSPTARAELLGVGRSLRRALRPHRAARRRRRGANDG